jgi:hypothetical protein
MFPGFSKNLLAAVKTLEGLVEHFRSRIRNVERDLWKEYQTLESNLELRTKRLDRLETMARSAVPSSSGDGKREIEKLREANRALKVEISTLRAAHEVRAGVYSTDPSSPSPSVPTGPRHRLVVDKTRSSSSTTSTRHHSLTALETAQRASSSRARSRGSASGSASAAAAAADAQDEKYDAELQWQVRLHQMEYKLKAEREARALDRSNALQRLEEKARENAELVRELERNKTR